MRGTVFNVMRFAVHDGPGIRTTVFLKGCPLCCPWCQNPEGQREGPDLLLSAERCIGCGECRRACPTGAARRDPGAPEAQLGCLLCGRCAAVCPAGARELLGRAAEAGEIVDEVARDTVFFDESGGGVTFSGGEPLAQPRFLLELARESKGRGLHVCVDTCGHGSQADLLGLVPHVDLFLYDVKLMDEERHLTQTGVSNRLILSNLRALTAAHPAVQARLPLIPGVNDDQENVARTGEFLSGLSGVLGVSVLPYHQAGAGKYGRLGRDYRLSDLAPPPPGQVDQAARILAGFGLRVEIGGRP